MDEVFRAIDDPSRRLLLDALFESDGQTLSELVALLPSMTRQGVMSHLRVLEEARLITTRRIGRSKLHYLNPVPIRLVHDRWISRFAEPRVGALATLTTELEGASMESPIRVYTAHIAAPRSRVWDAITNPEMTVQYFYGTRVESTWEQGSAIRYLGADDTVVADGEILAHEPESRVEMTFLPRWDPELEAAGAVREAWVLSEENGMTVLSIELYDIDPASATYLDFTATNGFPFIVSGLKTLVETGSPMS